MKESILCECIASKLEKIETSLIISHHKDKVLCKKTGVWANIHNWADQSRISIGQK